MIEINSIFQSISGECGGIPQGAYTTFIRLQGCNLRCGYCDAKGAVESGRGKLVEINDILASCWTKNVIITGGEPLFQPKVLTLIDELLNRGHVVQVETNGTIELPDKLWFFKPEKLFWVVDFKQHAPNASVNYVNWAMVWQSQFFLKFVVENENHIINAFNVISKFPASVFEKKYMAGIAISPAEGKDKLIPLILDNAKLMLTPKMLDLFILNIQIHKIAGLD